MASRAILMPKLGLTMTEGVIVELKAAPGYAVKAGETLFVVETDKISNEVDATEDGVVIAVHVAEGDTVRVGEVVATLQADGDAESVPVDEPAAAPADDAGSPLRGIATPLARRLARHAGLDLAVVTGSGPRGRIAARDVTAAIAAGEEPTATEDAPAPAPPAQVSADEVRPLNSFRKVVARRLTEAKRDIPHFYVFAEADVTALAELRGSLNGEGGHARLSVNHFILTALARALATTPEANVVWVEDAVRRLGRVDVGMAVETPRGLVAPLLRDVGAATVDMVAAQADAIVARARAGQLGREEMEGGASTVSNVGMFGATGLIPIVNPGQSSILGVGAARGRFRPDAARRPVLRQLLDLALSCDHRVLDGALAARFLQAVRHGLEAPATLLRPLP